MTLILQDKSFAEQRLRSAVELIVNLERGDWPYNAAKSALTKVKNGVQQQLDELLALDEGADPEIIIRQCRAARRILIDYSGFVGFALRSSNVRNAFEIYGPVKQLGEKLLGKEVNLIIGSEWNYAPFIYPLPGAIIEEFVLVGIPAVEAQNALLVPIAGHELGHAVWRRQGMELKFKRDVEKEIVRLIRADFDRFKGDFPDKTNPANMMDDLEARTVWDKAYRYGRRQIEELFCDFMGLFMFSNGYFHSFRYLLAHDSNTRIPDYYPSNFTRAKKLVDAAAVYDCVMDFPFDQMMKQVGPAADKFVEIAELSIEVVIRRLIDEAEHVCTAAGISRPDATRTAECEKQLRRISPTTHGSVAEIINAAWAIRYNLCDWKVPGVKTDKKLRVLNDVLLKSFELSEVAG